MVSYLLYTHNIYLIFSIFWVIQEIPNQIKSIFFYFFCVYSPKIAKSHIERSLIYRYICTNPHKVKNQLFFLPVLGFELRILHCCLHSLPTELCQHGFEFFQVFSGIYTSHYPNFRVQYLMKYLELKKTKSMLLIYFLA